MTISRKQSMAKNYDEILEKLDDIPTLSAVASKINELLSDPDSTAADVADLVKRDQVLTAKVLRMVNSPYYGIPGGVTDVERALGFLGFNTVAQIVMSLSVFSMFELEDESVFSITQFWKHCLAVAFCSEQVAKAAKYKNPAEAFTCGLLHDIGKTVLMKIDRSHFNSVIKLSSENVCSFYEQERAMEAPTHTLIGERVVTKWRLPSNIGNVIRYHHYHDIGRLSVLTEDHRNLLWIVRLSDLLSDSWKMGASGNFDDNTEELKRFLAMPMFLKIDLEQIKTKVEEGVSAMSGMVSRKAA